MRFRSFLHSLLVALLAILTACSSSNKFSETPTISITV
jgi:hypothetical protein